MEFRVCADQMMPLKNGNFPSGFSFDTRLLKARNDNACVDPLVSIDYISIPESSMTSTSAEILCAGSGHLTKIFYDFFEQLFTK